MPAPGTTEATDSDGSRPRKTTNTEPSGASWSVTSVPPSTRRNIPAGAIVPVRGSQSSGALPVTRNVATSGKGGRLLVAHEVDLGVAVAPVDVVERGGAGEVGRDTEFGEELALGAALHDAAGAVAAVAAVAAVEVGPEARGDLAHAGVAGGEALEAGGALRARTEHDGAGLHELLDLREHGRVDVGRARAGRARRSWCRRAA
jgi:hypothetical protein